jgi:hypothetical protein
MKQQGGVNDAAMMLESADFVEGDSRHGWLTDITNTYVNMPVDVQAGDVIWVAIFGLYDNDTWVDSYTDAEDATQFEMDLHIPTAAPANDVWADVWADTGNYEFNLSQGFYGEAPFGWYYPDAGLREGTTVGATADGGEGAIAGFPATRTVYYYMAPFDNETYKFWVESAVDCVLGIYDVVGPGSALGALIAEDDDSGPGNQPEITINLTSPKPPGIFTGNAIAVVVDSKTEGSFTLKFQRQPGGTPPANDDFADAELITSLPAVVSGTTVGATAEPEERNAAELGIGPRDTVWYKYVADHDGTLKIKATCDSNNEDAYVYVDVWKGTTLANLVRHPEPPPTGPGGGIFRGFFSFFDTPAELEAARLDINIVNGETYYIRVQTESGGSEDFTIYVDTADVYLKLTPSGFDAGPYGDVATVYLTLTPSGSDEFHGTIVDAATVPLTITPGAAWETQGQETTDSATIYVDLQVLGGECFSTFTGVLLGEGEAELCMATVSDELCIFGTEELEWSYGVVTTEGIDC